MAIHRDKKRASPFFFNNNEGQMKKLLLSTAALVALALPAHAKVCGSANGVDTSKPSDAALFNFYNGSCSSDNQANDGDDLKSFLDKGGSATFNGPDIDLSLTKNTSTLIDQNVEFKDLSATSSANGFTDGNGFANIKSVGDDLQSWEFDPLDGSIFGKTGVTFNGFDGILFRGQFADVGGGKAPKTDSGATMTIVVHLSDGSTVTDTFSGLKLNADDGVFGFDEVGTLPKGLFVDSVDAFTDDAHAWDQVKQIEFSVGGSVGTVPEPSTWVLGLVGFAALGGVGFVKRRLAFY
jgi:hypothetical protein